MDYAKIRRKTRQVTVGNIKIGGDAMISVQSMTNTDTHNAVATVAQIKALDAAGCQIARLTVPTLEAADTITVAKNSGVKIPLVADIHFDYKIALKCAEIGVDKIRINPGNIGSDDKVREVVNACSANGIPIRIGVNSGSLEKNILKKYGSPTPEALVESALYHAELLEKFGFSDIIISMKTTNVPDMITANRLLAKVTDYPIHIGVTESGFAERGMLRSAVGIGSLLCDGIGDTLRVSLTDDPVKEIAAAKKILNAVGIDGLRGMNIISCPTCGRTKIDLIRLANEFESGAEKAGILSIPIDVALMGCVVNGPGEAREADIGIAGGVGEALLFEKGEVVCKVNENEIVEKLIERIKEKYV